jgi:hypothetical protein
VAVKKKIAEGIIDLVRSPFERAIGPDFDPRFDPRKKEQERLQELTVGVEPRSMEVPEISLQDLEGRPFITSMSDLTAAGGMLTDVRGRPLEVPVNLRGGQDFMFDETLNPGQVWASARGPSGAIMAAAKSIQRKTKEEPLFIPWRMAPSGGDFATMTGETMLSFAASNMSKAEKKALDKAIREYVSVGKMVKGKRVGAGLQIKGWKGVDDPSFAEVWRKTPDSLRKELMDKVMDKQFRNRGGLSIGEARLAVSDASQLSAREGGIQNVGRVFADGDRAIERSTHPSYPYAVPGEGVGRIKEDVNIFQLLPEVVEERRIADPLSPSRRDFRSMQMGAKTGTITPEILRNIFGGGAAAGVGTGLMAPEEASASPLDRPDDVPAYMRRLDGTVKSERGFLGPIRNNVSGKTMTEVSIGQPGSEEGFYPLLVPTLTPEEVETIANMDLERERPPFSIIEKARAHAMERIDRGLSPFYQDGEEGAEARSPLERPEDVERRANARAVAVASDTLERLRRERGAVMSPLQDTRMARFGDYLTENRPSEMDPVQRALQSLGLFQGLGEYLRTTGEGQRTTTMQDINAALDVVPL